MGYVYGRTDSYAIGLWLLSATAALTLLLTLTIVRRTEHRHDEEVGGPMNAAQPAPPAPGRPGMDGALGATRWCAPVATSPGVRSPRTSGR